MTNTRILELVNQDNFINILKSELYALIDEEIAKDTDMDCDFIDELVNAIETLEQCENENPAVVLPLIFADGTLLSKRIRNKVNGKQTLIKFIAIAAAFALILSGLNQITTNDGKSILVYAVDEILDSIGDFFGIDSLINNDDDNTPPIDEIESTTLPNDENNEQQNNDNNESESPIQMVGIDLITYGEFKTSYLWKEEFDLTGLKVVAVYSDDTEKIIPTNDCEISGFNSLKLGEQTVTVKYKGFFAYFKVTVSKTEQNNEETRKITNIECKATGKDIIVPKGTENPALAKKVEYRYVYSDGTFSPWTVCKDAKLVSEYDSELIDTPQTLTYQVPNGMTFTINVIVYDNTVPEEKTVKKLEVYKTPTAMKHYASNYDQYYMYVNDECDFSQFQIKVYYSDNTNEIKILGDSEIKTFGTMSTERPSSYSGYTITFAYGDVTTTFKYEVIVKPEIQSYCFDEVMWECYYINDAPEEFNTKGIVKAKMTDSNKEIYLDVEAKGYDPTKIGYIELEIYYEGEYLGNYTAGYIYGNTGYAVLYRPITNGVANAPLNFRPYVIVAKCVGDGKLQTYGDIKYEISDNPQNNPSVIFESGTSGELRAMGITGYKCVCIDSSIVEYTVRADEYITEFGTHKAKVYLYNVSTTNNGWTYQKDSIAQDLSYTITIKEKPSYYIFDAPDNIKINIQDIYTEFYDKVHVYAVYEDGRQEEVFDYYISRYSPSSATTSARLRIYMRSADWKSEIWKDIYVYSDGYEDSFYITVEDNRIKEYENVYLIGAKNPSLDIYLNTATTKEMCADTDRDGKWSVEGWDTSTTGEKEAVITYHGPFGDLKTTYKYVVWDEYLEPKTEVILDDSITYYDFTVGFEEDQIKVFHINRIGKYEEIEDYDIRYYPTHIYVSYRYPKYQTLFSTTYSIPENIPIVGTCENITTEVLNNNDIRVTVDSPYPPANGYELYTVTVFDENMKKICHVQSKVPDITINAARYGFTNKEFVYIQWHTFVVKTNATSANTMYYSDEIKVELN